MEKQYTFTHADFIISVVAENDTAAFKAAHDVRFKELIEAHPKLAADGRGLVYLYEKAIYTLIDAVQTIARAMDRPSYLQSIMVSVL